MGDGCSAGADSHAHLGLSTLGREEKTQAGPGQLGTIMRKYTGYLEERQNGSRPVERGRAEEATKVVGCSPPEAMVTSGRWLLPRALSGSVAMPHTQSVLMSLAPVTTKGNEDRATQSWPHSSLAAALGRTGPVFHGQDRTDPAGWSVGEFALVT